MKKITKALTCVAVSTVMFLGNVVDGVSIAAAPVNMEENTELSATTAYTKKRNISKYR